MRSEIKVYSYPNGEIQRVHLVRPEDWSQIEFLRPEAAGNALACFSRIYRQYLVPACPWIFGNLVMFRLPEDMEIQLPYFTKKYGEVADGLTAAAAALRSGVRITGGKPVFRDAKTAEFWKALEQRRCLETVRGKLPITTIIPVGNGVGFLTDTQPEAVMKVNASFFIMDRFDCATVYDHVGTYFGLLVKDGVVESPPLLPREALIVKKDGSISVQTPDIRRMTVEIRGKTYRHGENAKIYVRPERSRTPSDKGTKLVIVGCRVAAVISGGSAPIPASGFVLCPDGECTAIAGDTVSYRGMEDVSFGIQVGNSIVRDGKKTEAFLSRFYNIRALERTAYPPSLYPLDFSGSRAARIAMGADAQGKPMVLWAEGAGKHGHKPGIDSCGATLADMARICTELGMVNGVNLDGGGSAQLLLHNRRALWISDRNPDGSESERPVPLGLMVKP